MLNLRVMDLNLLPVFEAVYEERNMTRAADRLAMTQPAVSNAVARLRTAVGDELFVAGRRGATVTPIAEQLYSSVKGALDTIRDGLGETRVFTPKESNRRFTVGMLYAPGIGLGQAFAAWLKSEAPHLSWKWVPQEGREGGVAALRDGQLDFLIDRAGPSTRDLDGAELFDDELIVVASGNHPRIGKSLSRKQFLAERHIVHRSLRFPGSLVEIEGALGNHALDVVLEVREPLELPITAAGTEFIAVCNRRLAAPWSKLLGLKILPLPYRAAPLKAYVIWHGSRRRDAGHRWVREGLVRLAAKLPRLA
jgi:LysR family transcriptional regulator, transcriptional activator for leuABCD operon